MTKIKSVSTRILALLMAMLMLCSGMVVSASATDEVNFPAPDCVFDEANRTITVKKHPGATINGTKYTEGIGYSISTSASMMVSGENYIYFNLEYGKTYTITAVLILEGKTYTSKEATFKVKKQQQTPAAPVPSAITSTSIQIINVSGCTYKLEAVDVDCADANTDWIETKKNAIEFGDLKPEKQYVITAKKKATTDAYESPEINITVTTKKTGKTVPAAKPVLLDKTNTTITIKEIDDIEFSIDEGKTWQSSGSFTGLKAADQYEIIAREKFDASVQDPNPASDPITVETNKRANIDASADRCVFVAESGEKYAGSNIDFTVIGDGPSDPYDVEYGDTKILPDSYIVYYNDKSDVIKDVTALTPANLSAKGTFTPSASYAGKTVTVEVTYAIWECKGTDHIKEDNSDAGLPVWEKIGKTFTVEYEVNLGREDSIWTKIAEFFESIANFLLNTVPAFFTDALNSDVWSKLFDSLGGFFD